MNFAETIANLRTELKTKNEAVTALTAERDGLAGQVTTLTEQTKTQGVKITELEGQVSTLTTANADLTTQLEAAKKNVAGQVIDQISAAGVPPVERAGAAANNPGGKTTEGLTGLARTQAAFEAQGKK